MGLRPKPDLLAARRTLETVLGYELTEDLVWQETLQKWQLRFKLTLDEVVNGFIPATTSWYMLISNSYPFGSIQLFPDKAGGITYTFQHQNNNRPSLNHPWRLGDLCVKTSLRSFARRGYDIEPYDADNRLYWHVERCKVWLKAADKGELVDKTDSFELPHFPTDQVNTIAFIEDDQSFSNWTTSSDRSGILVLKELHQKATVWTIDSFESFQRVKLNEVNWGDYTQQSENKSTYGIWIRFNDVPKLFPWQAPLTWSELIQAASEQGIDFKLILEVAFRKSWKLKPQVLALGFPIPNKNEDMPSQMYWQAILIPSVPVLRGIRPHTQAAIDTAFDRIFHRNKTIKWLDSENWNRQASSARGKLSEQLSDQRILVIGVGALGSIFSELLVRASCRQLTLLDGETVKMGNLARHSLTLNEVGLPKAKAVASRLNSASPHCHISAISDTLQNQLSQDPTFLTNYDLVIDATGSDEVIHLLSTEKRRQSTIFTSLSLGLNAQRLFFFMTAEQSFEFTFFERLKPWLRKDIIENEGKDLPRDGLGCWHPLFPARCDDVWMMSAAAIKLLEQYIIKPSPKASFIIIEQQWHNGYFSGIAVISDPTDERV